MQQPGKATKETLQNLIFNNLGAQRAEVRQGASFGVDVASIHIDGGNALVTASDPLSLVPRLSPKESAWLSIYLAANDLATSSLAPQYAQLVMQLPENTDHDLLKDYWKYIHKFCTELGVHITGGHTSFDPLSGSTLIGGITLLAIGKAKQVRTSAMASAGDLLLMTKSAALSSSSILVKSFPNFIKSELGQEVFEKVNTVFYQTSCVQDALISGAYQNDQRVVKAMHDVTEGGVYGAAYEFASASGLGIQIDSSKVQILEEVKSVCKLFDIDPLRSIGAGSLLLAVSPKKATALIQHLKTYGIDSSIIGEFTEKTESNIDYQAIDPYWEAYFSALNKGKD